MTSLHQMLDSEYGPDGDQKLKNYLQQPDSANLVQDGETPLHVATRRRRASAVSILLQCGADPDIRNHGNKTAFAHAMRRGFDDIVEVLLKFASDTSLNTADELAVAITRNDLGRAQQILNEHPKVVRTSNPEEDRLLADIAGRDALPAVKLLVQAGANLEAPGLDDGTPLHQAAWFAQPEIARHLIQSGAPINKFDSVHAANPLGWAVHGSQFSGGAQEVQEKYRSLVKMFLEAGSQLHYPDAPNSNGYLKRLHSEASPAIGELLPPLA